MRKLLTALSIILTALQLVQGIPIKNGKPTELVTVHVIAHSHDDAGWLKTVDQYYLGLDNGIYNASVELIISGYYGQLQNQLKNIFSQVEQVYFKRWYTSQNAVTQGQIKTLLKQQQLKFIGGGWVMNDEACPHYTGIIDQMTVGHRFLKDEFGYVPKTGWQIDPFGHSAGNAYLFAKMGFKNLFIVRIDYQDHAKRINEENLQFFWRPMKSFPNLQIWTGNLYHHYSPPNGFNFEHGDLIVNQNNVGQRSQEYISAMMERAEASKITELLVPQGDDFEYEAQWAAIDYSSVGLMMDYINKRIPQFNYKLQWSDPETYGQYVQQKYNASTWSVNEWDFFPYADQPYSYWTGYYTSRPALKGYIRSRSSLLHAIDQVFVTQLRGAILTGLSFGDISTSLEKIKVLDEAAAVTMHHDAITGTARAAVVGDYVWQLFNGTNSAVSVLTQITSNLFSNGTAKLEFHECALLNVSICEPVQQALNAGRSVVISISNPLAWNRPSFFQIPVASTRISLYDWKGRPVSFDILPAPDSVLSGAPWLLSFSIELPPLAVISMFLQYTSTPLSPVNPVSPSTSVQIENEYLRLNFDGASHKLVSIYIKDTFKTIQVAQDLMYYVSSTGDENSGQTSGAYIFRPDQEYPNEINSSPSWKIVKGNGVQEVRQIFSPWATQTFRLINGSNFFEVEATVGPIDISDGNGKEVISKYTTSLNSGTVWDSDSNGLEMQRRVRNSRPTWNLQVTEPVSGNYVPISSMIHIADSTTQFAVIPDRTRGGSSIKSGELETMIHRRCLRDDGRGLNQALDDSSIIRAKEIITINEISLAMRNQRYLNQMAGSTPTLLFAPTSLSFNDWFANLAPKFFIPMPQGLPLNLRLETLKIYDLQVVSKKSEDRKNGQQQNKASDAEIQISVLLRLHHIFAQNEDYLAKPERVNLSGLFETEFLKFVSCQEMSLTANQVLRNSTVCGAGDITIDPMDIRTFLVTFFL